MYADKFSTDPYFDIRARINGFRQTVRPNKSNPLEPIETARQDLLSYCPEIETLMQTDGYSFYSHGQWWTNIFWFAEYKGDTHMGHIVV